ncbi:DsbA family protein [Halobaculum sp. MBLA0147]|uniref:DsbA family protein n=1 Tax=Halobaculum sp. MBLA0147 TaxID=3079934 RepID=UPI003525BAC5
MDRRELLAGLAAAGLAGCLGGGGGGSDTAAASPEPSATPTTTDGGEPTTTASGTGGDTATGTSTAESTTESGTATPALGAMGDHPAAAGIRAEPRRGSFGGHTVLAFEDPSCVRCAAFHDRTVPKLRSNLVEPGEAAYVVRTYPVVYPWGKPATQALEATFARDAETFWDLLDHYFTNRSRFSTDTVYEETASFLADTPVDGEAVVADAREKRYDDAVQADVDAAQAADLGRTTPVLVLFRDGEFVTTANGSVSYSLIANALGEA